MEGVAVVENIIALSAPEVRLLALLPPLISLGGGENSGIGWLLELVMKSITAGSPDLLGPPASSLAASLRIRDGVGYYRELCGYQVEGKLRQ